MNLGTSREPHGVRGMGIELRGKHLQEFIVVRDQGALQVSRAQN